MVDLNKSLCSFAPLQARALKGTFTETSGDNTFTGTNTFTEIIEVPAIAVGNDVLSNLIWADVTVTATALDGGGSVRVVAGETGITYKVRDIKLVGGGTNFGAGGDRNISLTDGTTTYTTIANADIEAAPATTLPWGNAKVPFLTGTSNTPTVAGQDLRFAYSGGTTDHTTGSIAFSILFERIS